MTATQTLHQGKAGDELSPAEVLAALRAEQEQEDAAAARKLAFAAHWADLHPAESVLDAAMFHDRATQTETQIAGEGCPLVAEFCIAELGTTLRMSTQAAKRFLGQALELRHRLPRLWAAVLAGRVPAWRARLVADATIQASPALPMEAARWVDAQVTPFAHKLGPAQLDRLVAEAIERFVQTTLPEDPDDTQPPCPDQRNVTLELDQVGYGGTVRLEGELDLADALDLDHALRRGAEELKALGSTDPLDARRAQALGELARRQQALKLDLHKRSAAAGTAAQPDGAEPTNTESPGKLPAARRLNLHVHLFAAAVSRDAITLEPTGRLEEHQLLLLLDTVKKWCGDSHTEVRVLPVLDLAEEITIPGYVPTERQKQQIRLRDRTCVFPWCSRPARGCDVDHVTPYDHDAAAEGRPQPGPTTTSNLGALCRMHHRLKTHGRWRVLAVASGVFLWISPHGQLYLRDRTGTTAPRLPRGPGQRP